MAKYSSDSDSDRSSSRYRRKHTRRSSSLDSSDSSPSHQRRQKHSKGRRRRRSRSKSRDRNRPGKSYKHPQDSSRDRRKHRPQRSRSSSEERNSSRKRSDSREKSTSRSSSSQSNAKVLNLDKPGSTSRDNFLMSDTKLKSCVLEEINNDEFVPKQFVSTAKNKDSKGKNIVIDMNDDTIHVPPVTNISNISNSIFHTSIMIDKEAKFDRWVKKLYSLRQKAINEFNHS